MLMFFSNFSLYSDSPHRSDHFLINAQGRIGGCRSGNQTRVSHTKGMCLTHCPISTKENVLKFLHKKVLKQSAMDGSSSD